VSGALYIKSRESGGGRIGGGKGYGPGSHSATDIDWGRWGKTSGNQKKTRKKADSVSEKFNETWKERQGGEESK